MLSLFKNSYQEAREHFLKSAKSAGFDVNSKLIKEKGPDDEPLYIDVAVLANGEIKKAVVVSSGTHGIEGYFGSAVQISLIENELSNISLAPGEGIVMVHAVNPWGMAHKRRVNENNIDLNRNFTLSDSDYQGAPEKYAAVGKTINPKSAPGLLDSFYLRAVGDVLKFGFKGLKGAIAGGQYEFPQGLFFGGKAASQSKQILASALPPILGKADFVHHFDLHTASGPWKTFVHCVDYKKGSEEMSYLQNIYVNKMQGLDLDGVLYEISGALGPWLQSIMPAVKYHCMLEEFGTYSNLTVLKNMRFENRVLQYSKDKKQRTAAADLMMETFCPADTEWRTSCVSQAKAEFRLAMNTLFVEENQLEQKAQG